MTTLELYTLAKNVQEMRRLQKLYFKSRSKMWLQKAKAWEAQVDAELDRLFPQTPEEVPKGLFD